MVQRTRTLTELDGTLPFYRYLNGVLQAAYTNLIPKSSRTMVDHIIPSYLSRVKAGDYINNPCTLTVSTDYSQGAGQLVSVHKITGAVILWAGPGSLSESVNGVTTAKPTLLSAPVGFGQTAEDVAKSKCLADVDSTPYSFAEDIGEIKQTIDFIRRPWSSVDRLTTRMVRDARRWNSKRKALTYAKALSDVYLEYRFAFSPLMRSIQNAMVSLVDAPARPKRRTGRGFENALYKHSETQVKGAAGNQLIWNSGVHTQMTVSAYCTYEVSNPVMDWRFKYGLRFKDIPETLWAIYPLSFMYDRVFNISDAIRGITNLSDPKLKIVGAGVVTRRTDRVYYSLLNQAHSSYNSTCSPDTRYKDVFKYTRELWIPTVLDAIPPVLPGGLIDTSTKIADLGALILKRLR